MTGVARKGKKRPLRHCISRMQGGDEKYQEGRTLIGSRVADGVYETLLDGMEIEELWEQ